jgi:hypothetical protein
MKWGLYEHFASQSINIQVKIEETRVGESSFPDHSNYIYDRTSRGIYNALSVEEALRWVATPKHLHTSRNKN